MMTGKARGFKKGDFVYTGAYPGVIISDVHTFAPCCEVWGDFHECGGAYASQMSKMTPEEFKTAATRDGKMEMPFTKEAKKAFQAAGFMGA